MRRSSPPRAPPEKSDCTGYIAPVIQVEHHTFDTKLVAVMAEFAAEITRISALTGTCGAPPEMSGD